MAETKEKLASTDLKTGLVYTTDKDNKKIILGPEKGNYFNTSYVRTTEEDKEYLTLPGAETDASILKNLKDVVGEWSPERILRAYQLGIEQIYHLPPDQVSVAIEKLREELKAA